MAFIGAALGAFSGWIATSATGAMFGKLLVGAAFSALKGVLAQQAAKNRKQPGIKTEYVTEGGTQPMSAIIGHYATAGHMVCPPMSHGKSGKVSNAFLTYVVSLGDIPGQSLKSVIIDGEETFFKDEVTEIPIGGAPNAFKQAWWYTTQGLDPNAPENALPTIAIGRSAIGRLENLCWIHFYDGTQTTPNPYLLSAYGPGTGWDSRSKRPWTDKMVGMGTSYAIITFKFSRERYKGQPRCQFVLNGIRLYDPRKDGTRGGSGPQRADQPATWECSHNPMVQAYNILHGIPVQQSLNWGYNVPLSCLPLAEWTVAMNACDATVDGEARYRTGFEIGLDDEPADVLEEILKASNSDVVNNGGVWKPRVGAPSAPVYFFSDDDIILTDEASLTPFPGLDETWNGVRASYPEPETLWRPKDAPPRYNAEWEAADQGRRRVADLNLSACPYPKQVQRVMRAYIEEERRFRRHVLTLPPDAAILEPLDSVSWTSAENGYVAKIFEVADVSEDLRTGLVTVSLRERDAADYDWQPGMLLPTTVPPVDIAAPPPIVPQFFSATGISLDDENGRPRIPAAQLRWGGWALDGITGVRWEIRRGDDIAQGTAPDAEAGQAIVSPGLIPDTDYEARLTFVADQMDTAWTAWLPFHTPKIVVPLVDIDDTPPGVVTGLVLSSTTEKLTAVWDAATAPDFAYYDVRLRVGSGNDIIFQTASPRYEWPMRPNSSVAAVVRAVDRLGNKSAWSAEISHTTAADTIPPAAPAGLALKAGFNTIWVSWTRNTEADLDHYDVATSAASFTAAAAPALIVASITSNSAVLTEIPDGQTRFVRVRAVDTSGNASPWSNILSKQVVALPDYTITAEDLTGLVGATSFAAGIEPVTIVSSGALPTVKSTSAIVWGGKLYRWDGAQYTASAAASDLSGQIVSAQIAAGAVRAEQMSASAFTATVAGIGDFTNLVPDPAFSDDSAWGGTWQPSAGWPGIAPRLLRLTGSGQMVSASKRFPVSGDDQFWLSYSGRTMEPTGQMYMRVRFYDVDDTMIHETPSAPALITGTSIQRVTMDVPAVSGAESAEVLLVKMTTASGCLFARPSLQRKNKGELIVDGSLKATHMAAEEIISQSAQLRDAIITDAKVVSLSAAKLQASTALAGSITVSGEALSSIRGKANNPAAGVNAGTTQIDPGKILITGATTLADWRMGGDETRIDGGNLSANTVRTNALDIGARGVSLSGIQFEHNAPGPNQVSWSGGTVNYAGDDGSYAFKSVPAGTATHTGAGLIYIVYTKGATALTATTSAAVAFGANTIVLATYSGGKNLNSTFGRTVVDGGWVKTDTLTAAHMVKTQSLITHQAQMGNAVVDTLAIAGQAVTVPVYVYISATLDQVDAETDIIQAGINRQGFATFIQCYLSAGSYNDSIYWVRLYRNTTPLQTFVQTIAGWNGSRTSAVFGFVDADTGAGATTYRLTAQRAQGGNLKIEQRTLTLHQFKR